MHPINQIVSLAAYDQIVFESILIEQSYKMLLQMNICFLETNQQSYISNMAIK